MYVELVCATSFCLNVAGRWEYVDGERGRRVQAGELGDVGRFGEREGTDWAWFGLARKRAVELKSLMATAWESGGRWSVWCKDITR